MEVMPTLRTNRSKAKFVMRRGLATDNAIREAYALGVCGLVKKSMAVDVLVSTLRSVAEGNFPLDQRTSGLPRDFVRERNALKPIAAGDRLILRRLANGQTLKEIANALGISASGADKARARIKSRMKINGAAGLLHVGLNLGLVSPSRSSVARYSDGTKWSTPRVLSS
jgi:DNA-binding NarL/FixJ family response regulator